MNNLEGIKLSEIDEKELENKAISQLNGGNVNDQDIDDAKFYEECFRSNGTPVTEEEEENYDDCFRSNETPINNENNNGGRTR